MIHIFQDLFDTRTSMLCMLDFFLFKVMKSVTTQEAAISWASGFLIEEQVQHLTGSAYTIVSKVVERELTESLASNDSGMCSSHFSSLL